MKYDMGLPRGTLLLILASCLFPFLSDLDIPLKHGVVVNWIENAQAVWLLFGALFGWFYIKSAKFNPEVKMFWLWSVVWWCVLFGRSTSWGKAYFHHEPKLLYRSISVVLIAALALPPMLSRVLRDEIKRRLTSTKWPVWTLALVVITFLISDTVEHHRLLAPLFLHDPKYQDLIEELYEIPFMVGLFIVSYTLIRRDKHEASNLQSSGLHEEMANQMN